MITNLHTHTARCRHASGTEEAYVQAALKSGIQKLGFSDHTPYWFSEGHYSSFRMYPEQLPEYVDTVLALGDRYKGKMEIRLGLEAEYYPAFFPELLSRLKDTPVQYLLLGQHYIGNEIGDWYSGWKTADLDHLRRYCKQVADAMYTGVFTYLAHPDLINYVGDREVYRSYVRTVCKAANDCGLPLELNLLGIRENRHYPNATFWEVAAEEGCRVVLGVDAHNPESFLETNSEKRAREMIAHYSLVLIEDPLIRKL